MRRYPYPCEGCRQPECDYRHCEPYRCWFHDSWNLFHRHICHNYWREVSADSGKLGYVHPDVLRRYLQQGPCARCICKSLCDTPCKRYWQWWDARMVWLRWKLQQTPLPHGRGVHHVKKVFSTS